MSDQTKGGFTDLNGESNYVDIRSGVRAVCAEFGDPIANGRKPIPNLCPKVVLEGTRMTHKTDIALSLNEHPRFVGPRKYRYHSPIISAEWGGFQNEAWGQNLTTFDEAHERHGLETFDLWIRLMEHMPYLSWIVDRFHHSTVMYQKLYNRRHYCPS